MLKNFYFEGDDHMPERVITKTPYTSPDALRTFLQLSKKLYEQHTRQSFGLTDLNGLKYVGIVKNFGSEMLLESQKMEMNHPPLDGHYLNDTFRYYFQLKYADFIDTYEQQHMMMACVKSDTMLSNHIYQLKFQNLTSVVIMRAEADGDFYTRKSNFVKTFTNPKLLIDGVEYELYIDGSNNEDHHATYYFARNNMTEDLIDSFDGATLITVDLKSYSELPFIWICSTSDIRFPEIRWIGNDDQYNRSLLTIGTNGQHVVQLFPYIYGDENIPSSSDPSATWYIKAYGKFYKQPYAIQKNYSVAVERIEFVQFAGDVYHVAPIASQEITWDAIDTKITLCELEPQWIFHEPAPGDYDYDGETFNNQTYALIALEDFNQNITTESNPNPACIAAFNVIFSKQYYIPYETQTTGMRSGIHIDFTSDYSDHSVIKKNGIIYNLSDFDGLPPYYQYFLDRTLHHAHVEMYAIRDDANQQNQRATKKQTAAIILDSSVPQTDVNDIIDDMEPVLVYSYDRQYITDESKIVSNLNYLTNIAYIDNNHFGDKTIPKYHTKKPFVYHGNRRFSLGMISYDPDMEFGRGYLITNDPIAYENNATTKYPRAERTLARICDIPTSFMQLQSISGVAPTFVIDDQYTRQYASWNDDQFDQLWNHPRSDHFVLYQSSDYQYIPTLHDLESSATDEVIQNQCGTYTIQRDVIQFGDNLQYTISIANGGSGYEVGDEFGFNVGGIFFRGVVDTISEDVTQSILTFHLSLDPSIPGNESLPQFDIPMANFNGRISTYPLSTITGIGDGAILQWEIQQTIWNQFTPIRERDLDKSIYTFIYDPIRFGVTLIPYDTLHHTWDEEHRLAFTGDLDIGNPVYDDTETYIERRDWCRVMTYNIFVSTNFVDLLDIVNQRTITTDSNEHNMDAYVTYAKLTNGENLAQHISNFGLNTWNSFIALIPSIDMTKYDVLRTKYDYLDHDLEFPARTNLNVSSYDMGWNGLKFNTIDQKPIPYVYNPCQYTKNEYDHNVSFTTLTKSIPFNMKDLFDPNDIPDGYVSLYDSDHLAFNVYRFDHFAHMKELDGLRNELNGYTVDEVIDYIRETFGDDTIAHMIYTTAPYVSGETYQTDVLLIPPQTNDIYRVIHPFVASDLETDIANGNIKYEGLDTLKSDLINYCIANTYSDSVFDINNLQLYHSKNASISDLPTDDPIGSFIPVIDVFHENVTLDNVHEKAQPMFVFRLETASTIDLNQFRMYDGDVDISENTLLILNNSMYVFQNGTWKQK